MAADLLIMHALETTDSKICSTLRKSLVFLDWAVVREPLLLLEAAGFVTKSRFWKACADYLIALFLAS